MITLMPTEHHVRVDPRPVSVMAEPWNCLLARQPVLQEHASCLELHVLSADSPKLIWDVTCPRKKLLEDFALPMKSVRVIWRFRLIVDEAVRR